MISNEALKVRKEIDQLIFELEVLIEPTAYVQDMKVSLSDREIPVRVYLPPGEEPYPLLLYLH